MSDPKTTPAAAGSGAAPNMQNAGMNPLISMLMPLMTTQGSKTTATGGTGDVAGLQQLLATLMPTTNAAGMNPVLQAIFNEGFQKQMPTIYNASNQAGLRPSSTTQQQLLVNDLAARLSAEGAKAVNQQQQTAGQVATAIAQNTKAPVTTVKKDTSGVNTQNLLPALLLAGGLFAAQKAKGAMSSSGNTTTTDGTIPADSTANILGVNKKQGVIGGGTADIVTQALEGLNSGGGLGNVGIATTGSFNPGATGGGSGIESYAPTFNPSAGGSNGVAGNLAGQAMNYGINQLGATMGVPYVGPALAVADLLGVNEVTQPIQGITTGISDAISSVWNGITGGCYITTAVCELDGKPDNARELEVLRSFRDSWLATQPAGKELIQQYYKEAPQFLESLKLHPQRKQILETFRDSYILPAVHAVETGNNMEAFKLYVAMLEKANSFIQ